MDKVRRPGVNRSGLERTSLKVALALHHHRRTQVMVVNPKAMSEDARGPVPTDDGTALCLPLAFHPPFIRVICDSDKFPTPFVLLSPFKGDLY